MCLTGGAVDAIVVGDHEHLTVRIHRQALNLLRDTAVQTFVIFHQIVDQHLVHVRKGLAITIALVTGLLGRAAFVKVEVIDALDPGIPACLVVTFNDQEGASTRRGNLRQADPTASR